MLTYSNSVTFKKGKTPPIEMKNFFEPEDGFIWSESKWSEIYFSFSADTTRTVKSVDFLIELDVFKFPPELSGQDVLVYLNGLRLASSMLTKQSTLCLNFAASLLRPTENVLVFDTPDATKPSKFGLQDGRQLGIQLFSLQVRPAT